MQGKFRWNGQSDLGTQALLRAQVVAVKFLHLNNGCRPICFTLLAHRVSPVGWDRVGVKAFGLITLAEPTMQGRFRWNGQSDLET